MLDRPRRRAEGGVYHNLQRDVGTPVDVKQQRLRYREAAEAGVKAMQDEADKMLTNPAVKKAWDYFMMVWSLAKEQEKQS